MCILKRTLGLSLNNIFDGRWALTKQIDREPFFDGVAQFTRLPNDNLIAYREEGKVIHKSGYTGDGFREYFFQIDNLRNRFSVYFDQQTNELFHNVQLRPEDGLITGSANHLCLNDTYVSRYQFLDANCWTLSHVVHGPRKDYLMQAHYNRG